MLLRDVVHWQLQLQGVWGLGVSPYIAGAFRLLGRLTLQPFRSWSQHHPTLLAFHFVKTLLDCFLASECDT